MITLLDITPEEFEQRKNRPRSRWALLVKNLLAASDGQSFAVCLQEEENTGRGRLRARQSIYAIARYHRIEIKLCSEPLAILVMRVSGPKGATLAELLHP